MHLWSEIQYNYCWHFWKDPLHILKINRLAGLACSRQLRYTLFTQCRFIELHPSTHAQFVSMHFVQRLCSKRVRQIDIRLWVALAVSFPDYRTAAVIWERDYPMQVDVMSFVFEVRRIGRRVYMCRGSGYAKLLSGRRHRNWWGGILHCYTWNLRSSFFIYFFFVFIFLWKFSI